MPQNPEFTLNSNTLGVVYKDIGVLVGYASETAESPTESHAIIGAYYEPAGDYKGLYFVLPEGAIKYFDVDVVKLGTESNGAYITFQGDGNLWVIRGLNEEDGEWVSKYKMELPVQAIEALIVGRSSQALNKYLGVSLPEGTPEFESLTAFFSGTSKTVTALNYISSYGNYTRLNFEWARTDISADYYEDLQVAEIEPDKASELLEKYDDLDGMFPVREILKDYEVGSN
jgi:hypothetical protein